MKYVTSLVLAIALLTVALAPAHARVTNVRTAADSVTSTNSNIAKTKCKKEHKQTKKGCKKGHKGGNKGKHHQGK